MITESSNTYDENSKFCYKYFVVGFLIYAIYGVHYSTENKPLSAYDKIVSYAGTDPICPETMKPGETVHMQQPQSELVDHPAPPPWE